MAGQLIPPPEIAPEAWPPEMPSDERYQAWLGMLASGERLLIAGFQHKVGPDGDWKAEYSRWLEHSEADRLRHRIRRARELQSRRDNDVE